MSTPLPTMKRANIADVMQNFGQGGLSMPDLTETLKQVETVKSVKFAFHPWLDLPNFGPDGFRFNIPYPVLNRLQLIPLAVFQYPRIMPNPNGRFALMGATLTEAVPAMSAQSKVIQAMQMPSESMRELLTAYGKYGMMDLVSLSAQDEQQLAKSFILYEAVMGEAKDETDIDAGRRPIGLLLEDFPAWLKNGAPRALSAALEAGVVIRDKRYRLSEEQIPAGERLIQDLTRSLAQAEEAALSPSDGILPTTRKLLNITANRGVGGKTFLDQLDIWLQEQYPSFPMDTEVERAQKAMQSAMEAGNQGSDDFKTGVMALLQQQAQAIQLLTQLVTGQEKQKPQQTQKAKADVKPAAESKPPTDS